MSNRYSKILISIAMLMVVSSVAMSNCFAADLFGFGGLDKLCEEMHHKDIGDCWADSNAAVNGFTTDEGYVHGLAENGYKCAIVEGPSDMASNHRAVYVYMNEDKTVHCFEAWNSDHCYSDGGTWEKNWFTGDTHIVKGFNGY